MKSVIKIDIDDEGMPVLKIRLSNDQTDVRDKLLNRFFKHTETSNLLTFKANNGFVIDQPIGSFTEIDIYPVKDVIISNDHTECMFGVMSRDEVIADYAKNYTEPYEPNKD